MSKQIKKGNIPVNARVDIDYTGKKPKIKFSYPKKNAAGQNIIGLHTFILLIVWIIFYIGFEYYMDNNYLSPTLPMAKNCNITINQSNYYGYTEGEYMGTKYNFTINNSYLNNIFINCEKSNYSLYINYKNQISQKSSNLELATIMLIMEILSMIIILVLNWLITKYLVKQQWYKEWLPKHEAWTARNNLRYFKFLPKDLEGNMIIIPNFKNVVLKYDAQGDFSKQLTNLKIREQQYFKTKKGKKVGKLKKDVYNWSAIFFFKEKPKSGYLEVLYY